MDTAASIIAIVQLSEKVIKYVNSVKGAKDDRGRLRDQVRACSMILLQLQDAAEDADDGEAWSNTIAALSVPLARLHRALEMAAVKLHQKDDLKEKMKWPFNEKEVQKLIDAIEGEKSLLLLALENNSAKLLHEIHARSKEQETRLTNLSDILETHILSSLDSFQDLRSTMSAIQDSHSSLQKDVHDVHGHQKIQEQGNKRQKLLTWLSTIDHAAQQRDVLSRYQEGTGQWLLEADNFRDWRDGCIRTLFCPGPPGAGKTTITSLVVTDLKAQYCEVPSARVAFLYCGFNHRSTQTPETLLSSLLKQLVEAQSASSKSVVEFYDRHTKAASSPTLKNVMDAIGQEIQTASKVFIVIDALDECRTDNGCRMKLLSELFKLQKECNICLLATSRALPDIIRRFERSKSLEIRASPRDIQAYLDENMYRLPSFVGRNEVLQDEIRSNITTAVDGMFLLAKLHIDSLVGKRSLRAVRDALKNLLSISKTDDSAKVYDSAYRDAMERISGQVPDQAEMAKQVLAFIVHTREPLTGAALQEALGIEIGDRRFDPDNCPAVDDMISACAGLVTLDIGEGVIRLVHYTAREFFQRTQQTWFPDAEAMITRICATFIAMERTSFANSLGRYAKRNWGYHAALAPSAVTQALEFLLQPDKVEYAAGWGSDYREFQFREVYDERKTTGMHLAAFHGLDAIIPAILHAQPDTATSKGLTPLMIAGMRGHVSTLRLLLDYNVAVDAVDSLHQTALWLAAREGRTAVGRALIDSRAHCMIAAASGSTPLHVATLNHHDAFVQLLIERGANLDEPNKHGEIALFMAAQGDEHHAGVMRLLLDAGTEVNYRSEDKWSPLHAACEGGCEILIRLLLDAGADVNSQNQQGTSPLHIACELGYLDIVDILLVAGADANLHDDKAITPLEAACRQGHEQVALLLLDAGADVQCVNHYGGSPLHAACVFGYGLDIIRRLLLMGAVVNLRDTTGRTPLFYAGIKGYRVIKLLLDAGAEADCLDNDGIPLLSGPCGLGHERSLEYLLAAGADVNLGSEQGFSPLLDATNSDEEAIVRHLIHHGAQVDCVDREGRSALFYAARNGSESLVRLLLGHVTDVKLDCMGRSPLFLMTGDPSAGVVRLLLDQGMDPNIQDEFGDTASSFARSVLEQQGTRVIQPLVSSVRKQVHTDVTGLNFTKEPSTAQPDLSHRKDAEVNAGEASSEDTAGHTPIITEEEKHASANEPIKTLTLTSEQNEDQHLSIPLDSDFDPDSDSDSDDSHPTAAPSLSSFYTTYLRPEDSDWTADVRACIALLEGRTPSPASVAFHPPLDPESDYINRAERSEVGGEIVESESPVDGSETGSEDSDDYRPRVRYVRRETNDDR